MEINLNPDNTPPHDLREALLELYQRAHTELQALGSLEPFEDDQSEEAVTVRAAIEERRDVLSTLATVFRGQRLVPLPLMPVSLN